MKQQCQSIIDRVQSIIGIFDQSVSESTKQSTSRRVCILALRSQLLAADPICGSTLEGTGLTLIDCQFIQVPFLHSLTCLKIGGRSRLMCQWGNLL